MNKFLNRMYKKMKLFGLDPKQLIRSMMGMKRYWQNLNELKKQKAGNEDFYFASRLPMMADLYKKSGVMSGHYFHQDLLIARKIFINNPKKHVDIGSRTDGFVAHVAVFREIEILDIREQKNDVKNIIFTKADLMKLPDEMKDYCDSVSALHSIEHFGLGRYGDPVDYYGHKKGIESIYKMLRNGGKFYFSVPIGEQRIEFNAHRVFSVLYLIDLLKNKFGIDSFSYVDDKGNLFEDVSLENNACLKNFGCHYGCGIFELTKK